MNTGDNAPTKGARKAGVVMKEFAKGTLHSGSKKGPVVTDPAQAKAIAMSEKRRVAHGGKKST